MAGDPFLFTTQLQHNLLKFLKILSKYSRKFSRNSKKRKLKKGRENLQEVWGRFYFEFEKILSKIGEILEQTLKRLEFL